MILFNKAEPFFNLLYLQNGMSDIIYKEAMQYAFPLFSLQKSLISAEAWPFLAES